MNAQELLERAGKAGLSVVADSDRLVVKGPKQFAHLAQLLIQHKTEILCILAPAARVGGQAHTTGDGDETPMNPRNEEVVSPATAGEQRIGGNAGEPNTLKPDEVKFWLDCLRDGGAIVQLVNGQPAIEWPTGFDTPGRLRDWNTNIDQISAILQTEENRRAAFEEAAAALQRQRADRYEPSSKGLIGCEFPGRTSNPPPKEICATSALVCPECETRRVLPELSIMTTGLCWTCWVEGEGVRS